MLYLHYFQMVIVAIGNSYYLFSLFFSPRCCVVVVQSLSCVQLLATPCTAACQAPLSCTIFTQIHVHWVIQRSHPLLPLLLLPSVFPTITVFSNELSLHIRWQSIGTSASASVLPMIIQGWFPLGLTDLLAVQGNFKSLLWHHNSKASILWCSAFFLVHLSHPYMTTGKTTVKLFSRVRLFATPWTVAHQAPPSMGFSR